MALLKKKQQPKRLAKRARKSTGKAVAKVDTSSPLVKRLPIVLGAVAAAFAAFKFARSRGGDPHPAT
ncbi:MAG TPA: hypothetical protein VNS09_26120 [Solirubrobacter sp.]|nr:hypothetical protein [Solirubrobacter sp.]